MISPDEIKVTANKWWREILQCELHGEIFFPRILSRFGKIKPNETILNFDKMQQEISSLRKHSKENVGYGYTVTWTESNNRKIGRNLFPTSISIDSQEDYLKLLKKENEFKRFKKWSLTILAEFPELKEWISRNPEDVMRYSNDWTNILKVCTYFKANPKPDVYVRQLPIEVHTKFVEEQEALIASLLDFIITDHINRSEKNFLQRHNLRYDEPLIRVRFLDPEKQFNGQPDISIPISRFRMLDIDFRRILIAENKMNFLTLPELNDTIAIWSGGGFYVRYLADVSWIYEKQIYYWGDLDTHGFHILNQVRGYYKQTKSMMMDQETLNKFKSQWGSGSPTNNMQLDFLTNEELELYAHLKTNNIRLEQEKVAYDYAVEYLSKFINFNEGAKVV
ncbi:MAG: Wadjet anti-phage system protein JetD domain-containing protein [Chryseolinea sp.]